MLTREQIEKRRVFFEMKTVGNEITEIREHNRNCVKLCDMALASLAPAPASDLMKRLETAEKVAQVAYDLHAALKVKWGDDPYTVISRLQEAAAALQAEKE